LTIATGIHLFAFWLLQQLLEKQPGINGMSQNDPRNINLAMMDHLEVDPN
jgi:hypothetical protein